MSLVSIIIPTYNRATFLGSTLDSILHQTYMNWECIIVDDGSNDYTKELMTFYYEKDDRFQYYNRPSNRLKGANSCRNYGFEICKGQYINWFDSDDLMHSNFLKIKTNELLKHDADCVICANQSFKVENGNFIFKQKSKLENDKIFENICLLNYAVPTHAPLWKRSFLNSRALFNENLTISQDLEFHSRVMVGEIKVAIVKKALFFVRSGHDNITSQLYLNLGEHFDSYFNVRKSLLEKFIRNKRIFKYYRNELMGIFRYLLALKEYEKATIILKYLYKSSENLDIASKINFFKIYLIFGLIKIFGKGETKLKRYLYLPKLKH